MATTTTQKIPAQLLKELKRKSKYPEALEHEDRPTVEMPKAAPLPVVTEDDAAER